jgi:hypothetical protein
VNPYFQSFSCVFSYYRYPISTWSKSTTSLLIKLMSNSYLPLSISIHVSLINYDAAQLIESSSPRSYGDSNRFGPARVSLPHDICRSRSADPNLHISTLTRILQNGNRSSATREPVSHLLESFKPDAFTSMDTQILPPSLHFQCAVIVSHNRIA